MTGSPQTLSQDRSYRVYSLSDRGGITGAESREFGCDTQALLHAQGLLDRHAAVEVWQTHRFVGRLDRRRLWNDEFGNASYASAAAQ